MPFVGVRTGRFYYGDRAGAGLDEVQQCPGDAKAVIWAEAAGQGLGFVGRAGLEIASSCLTRRSISSSSASQSGSGPPATKAWTSSLIYE